MRVLDQDEMGGEGVRVLYFMVASIHVRVLPFNVKFNDIQ